ncbi:MAG: CcmD family protein [Chitinophagales bacterium]|nr:CcmD family protein [Chitinophagales bacterium]
MRTLLTIFFSMLFAVVSFAQGETGSENIFKSNLKIYVVAAVLTIILACLFAFMFAIERRLKKLEEK